MALAGHSVRTRIAVGCLAMVLVGCQAEEPRPTSSPAGPSGTSSPTAEPTQPSTSPAATPTTGVVAAVEITPAAVLLTAAGQTRPLTAVALGADGIEMPIDATVTWASSNEAVVAVDASGTVTATAALGSATISASFDGVTSAPAYVTVAQPVAGAVLITDAQIMSGPAAVDTTAEPDPEAPYEVVLRGVPDAVAGATLINTESKPVAGRVMSITPEGADARVRLVTVPPGELFEAVDFSDTVDLSKGPYEIPAELAAAYDVTQTDSTFVFTPKAPTAMLTAHTAQVQGTRALPYTDCQTTPNEENLPLPLALSVPPVFTFGAAGSATRQVTPAGTKFVVQAMPSITVQTTLEVKAAFEAKVTCKLILVTRKFRVPGWAGLFFGGDVEFGVGFEVGGKVTLVSAKVGGKAEFKATLTGTLDCPANGSCDLDGNTSVDTPKVEPVLEAPNLNQLRFEPAVNLFAFVTLEAGNADVDQLQFEAIEAKAGLELAASMSFEGLQIDNTNADDGRSKYELAIKGEVGPGVKVGEFLAALGLGVVQLLKLEFKVPLGESPTGTVTADKPRYLPGDTARVSVSLDAGSTLFPAAIGLYNIRQVAVVRRDGLSTEVLGTVDATDGQTSFDVEFTSTHLLDASDLFAFVTTKLLPLPPKLEIGQASWSCKVAGPETITSIDDDPDKIYVMFDGASNCRLVSEVGDNGFQGDASDMVISIDTDPDESGWDGEDSDADSDGVNWDAVSGFGQNISPGTHTLRSRHVATGVLYDIKVTVQVEQLGGDNTRMTVRDVSITLAN